MRPDLAKLRGYGRGVSTPANVDVPSDFVATRPVGRCPQFLPMLSRPLCQGYQAVCLYVGGRVDHDSRQRCSQRLDTDRQVLIKRHLRGSLRNAQLQAVDREGALQIGIRQIDCRDFLWLDLEGLKQRPVAHVMSIA